MIVLVSSMNSLLEVKLLKLIDRQYCIKKLDAGLREDIWKELITGRLVSVDEAYQLEL